VVLVWQGCSRAVVCACAACSNAGHSNPVNVDSLPHPFPLNTKTAVEPSLTPHVTV
jgi:hypothetical protein